MIDFEVRARNAMADYGLNPHALIMDGRFHRFPVDGKNKNGWYIVNDNGRYANASFGTWTDQITRHFSTIDPKELSHVEKIAFKKQQKENALKIKKARDDAYAAAALEAAKVMDNAAIGASHPYLERKQVPSYAGVGVHDGVLHIPMYNKEMNLVNVEKIYAKKGSIKHGLPEGQRSGVFYVIGNITDGCTIAMTEGYATGASVHMATGLPVVVTFGAGNMPNVTPFFKAHEIIIAADLNENGVGEKQALEAAKKVPKCRVVVCPFPKDFNDLHVAQGLDAVRDAIFPPVAVNKPAHYDVSDASQDDGSGWWDEWVYINHEDKFYSLTAHMRYSITAFNLQNGYLVPEGDKGSKGTASAMVTNDSLVKVVAKAVYAPNVNQILFRDNNLECVNVFNPKTLPKAAAEYTQGGRDAIEMICNHIRYICNCNEEHTSLMLNWLAWQLQRKGQKILWCPVIQGVEGTGKSFFADLLEHLLGHENINTVAPREVLSQFNGWATNACVSVLSEIRLVNQDRYEAVNALKPLITDQVVQINIKNVPAYNVRNVTNYICMTNFKDAIPVTSTDRRWWILYSDYDTLDDFLRQASPNDPDSYFIELYHALRTYSSEVVKWFSEYVISPDFERIKQAPKTIYKDALLRNEQEKSMPVHDAMDLLESGGDYFNMQVLCAGDFFARLKDMCEDFNPQSSQRATFLMKLGFSFHKSMKIDGKTRKVWCKKLNLDDEYIKEELRKTLYK